MLGLYVAQKSLQPEGWRLATVRGTIVAAQFSVQTFVTGNSGPGSEHKSPLFGGQGPLFPPSPCKPREVAAGTRAQLPAAELRVGPGPLLLCQEPTLTSGTATYNPTPSPGMCQPFSHWGVLQQLQILPGPLGLGGETDFWCFLLLYPPRVFSGALDLKNIYI